MGKLNYQARKIEGVKAGQVVSKDLKKRIPPGTYAKVTSRDAVLELDVSGKRLTDEGFGQFIDDLIECIKFRDREHPDGAARLVDFILNDNELSVKSLPKLAEVVALSAGDLRELDISNNEIRIQTPEDKVAWQGFLESFKHCYMLKKLDLGSNELGLAGMEVLARVYIHSDLDFLEDDAAAILGPRQEEPEISLATEMESLSIKGGKENEPIKGRPKKLSSKQKGAKANGRSASTQASSKTTSHADLRRYACTRGLRSIPYLILSDTCSTNAEAIHLSSILSMQRSRKQLLAFLPTGKVPTLPNESNQCRGIIWLPSGLDTIARKMVDVGEAIWETIASDFDSDDPYENRRASGASRTSGDAQDSNNDSDDQRKRQKKLDTEFMRLAKRVRMDALKNNSVHTVDIWSTALKMMVVSRALLLDDEDRVVQTPPVETPPECPQPEEAPAEELAEPEIDAPEEQIPEDSPPSPPKVYISPFHPASEAFDSEFPALKAVRPVQVAAPKEEPKIHEAPETSNTIRESLTPEPSSRQDTATTRGQSRNGARQKQVWRGGLPLEMWRRIIANSVGADGILSKNQQVQIMRYAADWDVMAYKMTIQGAEEYQQIWKFLETVKCFTYSSGW